MLALPIFRYYRHIFRQLVLLFMNILICALKIFDFEEQNLPILPTDRCAFVRVSNEYRNLIHFAVKYAMKMTQEIERRADNITHQSV